ncbi:MAG TPA: FxLYD domain-containing protein [bacterium]|nr:FxLYD domain-containing protein [bacterium]
MKGLLTTLLIILGAFALTMRGTWTGDHFHEWMTSVLQTMPAIHLQDPGRTNSARVSLVETHPHPGCTDSSYGCIAGTVKNNTATTLTYVEVVISLYNASGAQVGDATTNTLNLEPGGTWNFEAPITQGNVASYRVARITTR